MKILPICLSIAAAVATIPVYTPVAQASFGDFMLGVGAGVGTSALINSQRRSTQNRYRPVSPDEEFARGLQDGLNNARFDNPRNSPDYTRGFQEGLSRRM